MNARYLGPLLAEDRLPLLDYEAGPRSPAILASEKRLRQATRGLWRSFGRTYSDKERR